MNSQKLAISLAIATVINLGVIDSAEAKGKKEKCYGIATAGQNDCGNLAGTHSCAGQSTVDKDIGEWKLVPKGECVKLEGYSKEEAKAMFKKMKNKK